MENQQRSQEREAQGKIWAKVRAEMRPDAGLLSLLGLLLAVGGLASGVLELALAGLIVFVPSMIVLCRSDS